MLVKNKKADITWGQIVFGALALIVLIIVLMVFTGQFGKLAAMFGLASDEAGEQATRTSWCMSTLTKGQKCEWDETCSEIAQKLGGQTAGSWKEPPNLKTDCKDSNQIRTYSKKESQFCCIKV